MIGGKKFDMRIYLLVTSFKPLTIYLYREAFCRFTHQRYNKDDLENTTVHLTNVAVQKHSIEYKQNSAMGGKWDLRRMKLYLISL